MTGKGDDHSSSASLIPELSVVIPVFDEEESLGGTLAESVAALEVLCDEWEIIVVDDGSSDGTPGILRDHADRDERVRVLTQHGHRGYGLALRRGFDATRFMVVCTTDAQGQYDLNELPALYPFLRDAEMVAGIRTHREAAALRRFLSLCYNRLQTWMLGVRAQDVNCSFKLYRKSLLYMLDLTSDGVLINAEIFAQVQRAGLRWSQVHVSSRPRRQGRSKIGLELALPMLVGLIRLRREIRA